MANEETPKNKKDAFFFNIDNVMNFEMKDLVYEGFYEDFGPLNLSKIWKYTSEIQRVLSDKGFEKNIIYHHTSPDFQKSTNSCLLICAFLVLIK